MTGGSLRIAPGAAGRFFSHQDAAVSICAAARGETLIGWGELNRSGAAVPDVLAFVIANPLTAAFCLHEVTGLSAKTAAASGGSSATLMLPSPGEA